MTDSYIQLPLDATQGSSGASGKQVDTSLVTTTSGTVQRQRIVIGDPTASESFAFVSASGSLQIQGLQATPLTQTGNSVATLAVVPVQEFNVATITLRTFTGTTPSVTWSLQASDDSTNWVTLQGINNNNGVVNTSWVQTPALTAGTAGPSIDYTIGAYSFIRINITAISGATATATFGVDLQTMAYESSPGALCQGLTVGGQILLGNPVAVNGVDGGNLVRTLLTNTLGGLQVNVQATTSGSPNSLTYSFNPSLTKVNIKATPGNLYGMVAVNLGATGCFIQVFDSASTPSLGSSVIYSVFVPAGQQTIIPANAIPYSHHVTGIGIGATTNANNAVAPTVNPSVTVFYT